MLRALELIARLRIEAAMERGEFDNLPGQGQPQSFEDERLIPLEQRMAYRLLRSSGFVPEGVRLRKRLARLEAQLAEPDTDRRAITAQLAVLRARLDSMR